MFFAPIKPAFKLLGIIKDENLVHKKNFKYPHCYHAFYWMLHNIIVDLNHKDIAACEFFNDSDDCRIRCFFKLLADQY